MSMTWLYGWKLLANNDTDRRSLESNKAFRALTGQRR